MTQLWQDRDKRRAFLLSLVVHLLAILLIIWAWQQPRPLPLESFLVIDVGTPQLSETVTEAPAAQDPAPQAAEPQVAAAEVGAPVAESPPEAAAPPPEVAEAPDAPEPIAEPPAPLPEVAEAAPEPEPQAAPAPPPTPVEAPAVTAAPPAAELPQDVPAQLEAPPAELTATVLPEIEAAVIDPDPAVAELPIPQPAPLVEVSPALSVAITPTVQLREPAPAEPTVTTPAELPVPTPQISATVASSQTIPSPQVAASVAQAREVPVPQVSANVSAPQAIPLPQVSTSVAQPVAIPQPQVTASVASARPIPTPAAAAAVSAPATEAEAVASTVPDAPVGETAAIGPVVSAPQGGNAPTPGQTTADPAASAENLGAAASPEGGAATGAPFIRVPFSDSRLRPITVIIDNAVGYPQLGLAQASSIIEMPVEGGLTRLMTVYDRNTSGRVGPIRSARPYFHELSESMNAIMVHDGGSPDALAAIARSANRSINSFTRGELFRRDTNRSAPYNLFSSVDELRRDVGSATIPVSGTIFRPDGDAPAASAITARFSGAYSSGFRFLQDLNRYRWVRNGQDAVDGNGEAVLVDAVLVATIDARPIPDDPEGRLHLPLRGGPATLYLRGRSVEGRWELNGGVRFVTAGGEVVSLAPFKTWVMFVPAGASVAVQ